MEICKSDNSLIRMRQGKTEYSFLPNGSIHEFARENFVITQIPAGLTEEAVGNIWLRVYREDGTKKLYPLWGGDGVMKVSESALCFERTVEGIACRVTFCPVSDTPDGEDASVWIWNVSLTGSGENCDLVYIQDIGVADRGALQANVLYQSQYLGHHVGESEEGYVIASRQNMDQGGRHPMLQQGSLGIKIVAYATDAFQIFGTESKKHRFPRALTEDKLPSGVCQYELACIALQTERFVLDGERTLAFYGYFLPDCDRPDRQSERGAAVKRIREAECRTTEEGRVTEPLRLSGEMGEPYASEALGEEELKKLFPERSLEEFCDGKLLGFFTERHHHVVLQEKELRMERPHGHILLTAMSDRKVDKELLTVTNYMYGVFASQLVVGNVDSNPLLDATRDTLNLHTQHGIRIYVRLEGKYRLLTMPAVYEMGLNFSRWYYILPDDMLVITAWVAVENAFLLQVESRSGKSYDCLFQCSLALAGEELRRQYDPDKKGVLLRPGADKPSNQYYPELEYRMAFLETEGHFRDDGLLYADGRGRNAGLLLAEATGGRMTLFVRGTLGEKAPAEEKIYSLEEAEESYLKFYSSFLADIRFCGEEKSRRLKQMNEMLPWYLHDAMIHFAAPHGLEQSGGAAWGTRDVCQGPMELFLTAGHLDLARETLLEIFAHQNLSSGEWPQYFMYDRYPYAAGDCHGDVVFWPLKSIVDYLEAGGDPQLLDVRVSYRDGDGDSETILRHIERAVESIRERMLPGTHLVNYAGGDWDDTLQPARPEWKERLCSAWTDALAIQVISGLGRQLQKAGRSGAQELLALAEKMRQDFTRYLVRDGVIAGFILMEDDGQIKYLLHPLDQMTGIQFRLLPLTRSIIAGIADEELAAVNEKLIEEELTFPDGVRLMNRPATYNGGKSVYFQRAEQAANVGREIGILYVHAHIRYLEAMARLGRGDKLWKGVLQVNPILLSETVPNAALRQSNTYFSSSDADVSDRYEFSRRFEELRRGEIAARGGWRIYSSGPGIYLSRVIRDMLGIRMAADQVELNPVLPVELDGVKITVTFCGRTKTICYRVHEKGFGAAELWAGGVRLPADGEKDLYRQGGIRLSKEQWLELPDELTVHTC